MYHVEHIPGAESSNKTPTPRRSIPNLHTHHGIWICCYYTNRTSHTAALRLRPTALIVQGHGGDGSVGICRKLLSIADEDAVAVEMVSAMQWKYDFESWSLFICGC